MILQKKETKKRRPQKPTPSLRFSHKSLTPYLHETCGSHFLWTSAAPKLIHCIAVIQFMQSIKSSAKHKQSLRARIEQTRCRVAVNYIFFEGLGTSFSRVLRHSLKWREERSNRLFLNFCFFSFKRKEGKKNKRRFRTVLVQDSIKQSILYT